MKIKTLHILGITLFAGLLLGGCSSGVIDSEGSVAPPGSDSLAKPVTPGEPGRGRTESVITDVTPLRPGDQREREAVDFAIPGAYR